MPAGAKPGERRGGRKAGVPNKKTRDLMARVEEIGFDPIDLAVDILTSTKFIDRMKASDRVNACLKLAEFLYPKRKSVEVTEKPSDMEVEKTYVTEWGNRREASDNASED